MSGHEDCDEGKRATFEKVDFDFSTRYVFEKISSRYSFLDKDILELGCGAGRLSYLALKRGAASVTLVDASQRALSLAKGLFLEWDNDTYRICHSDVFAFQPEKQYDLVFSAGLIEHFRGEDRTRIIKKHLDLSRSQCIMVHPADTLSSRIFKRFTKAATPAESPQCFSDTEINSCLSQHARVRDFTNVRFHPFFAVPLLHDMEGVNRLFDGASQALGGLTLTSVRLEPDKVHEGEKEGGLTFAT